MKERQLVWELRPHKIDHFSGNREQLKLIAENLAKNKFPHLTMNIGKPGTGKSACAEYVAMSLTCTNKKLLGTYVSKIDNKEHELYSPDPCLECEACKSAMKTGLDNGWIKKIDMTKIGNKNEMLDTIKEMFSYETEHDKKVFVLEEFQECDNKAGDLQAYFYDKFTSIPDDVYIIITTMNASKVSEAILNRCVKFYFKNLTLSESVEYVDLIHDQLGFDVIPNELKKKFVKACNNNPRTILTNMEMFIGVKDITSKTISSLFDLGDEYIINIWKSLFNKEVSIGSFVSMIESISSESNIFNVFNGVRQMMLDAYVISNNVIEDEFLSTVDKGEIKALVLENESVYSKVLEIFEKHYNNENDIKSILVRAKLATRLSSTTESKRQVNAKTQSNSETSFFSRYKS